MQTQETSFNSVTATLVHSFVRKNVFYCKNVQYTYNFCGTDLYPPVSKWMQRRIQNQSNIYGGASLLKSQKSLDARLGSKYISDIGFAVEKVYRISIFI